MAIDRFAREFNFLSNFHVAPVTWRGRTYKSSEHAYQAAKAKYRGDHDWVQEAKTPFVAKKRGRLVEMVDDFDERKVEIMREILVAKFKNPTLREALLATGDETLIEGNYWHDTFWGICTCEAHKGRGDNWLGRLLMNIREELRDG